MALITGPFVPSTTQQSRTRASQTAATTGTTLNVTASALALTPGIWILGGAVGFENAASTSVTKLIGAISLTSATLPTGSEAVPTGGEVLVKLSTSAQVSNDFTILTLPNYTITVTSNTNYFLVAQATFTVSTLAVFGSINATKIF